MGKGKASKTIEVDGIKLTPKEFAFCNYYLQHQNAHKAVIEAGYKAEGKHPRWVAYELLHRDRIKRYLAIQFNVALTKEKTAAIMDEFLTSDLGDIFVRSGNSFDIEKMHNAGVSHLIKTHRSQKTRKIDAKGNPIEITEIRVEREDKVRAAELLLKLQGWLGTGNSTLGNKSAAELLREKAEKFKFTDAKEKRSGKQR